MIVQHFTRPTLARPCDVVHWRTSLMSSSLCLQQCLTCHVLLIWMVLVLEGRWLYSCSFVESCLQDLFNIACSILVQFPLIFFSTRFVSVHVMHWNSRIDTATIEPKNKPKLLKCKSIVHIAKLNLRNWNEIVELQELTASETENNKEIILI